jgi:adenylate cyclase
LSGNYLYPVSAALVLALIVAAGIVGALLSQLEHPLFALALLAALASGYALLCYVLFNSAQFVMPFIAPQVALLACFAIPAIERAVEEETARRRLHHIFEQFIAPEMVDELLARGVEGFHGQRATLTILFADMRGFTSLSEKLAPDALVRLLNEYLAVMTEVIFRQRGTIDKFQGDAILAFWGAPAPDAAHARHAVRAALEMQDALEHLHARSSDETLRALKMGIGINTGEVFVGLIGSARRVNYTVIGDAVNLAARIQDQTKEFGVPILMSETTFQNLGDEFDAEFVGTRTVKGKTVPVNLYHVRGIKTQTSAANARAVETKLVAASTPASETAL